MTLFTDRVDQIKDKSITVLSRAENVEMRDSILQNSRNTPVIDRPETEDARSKAIADLADRSSALNEKVMDLAYELRLMPKWKKFILNRIIF